VVLEIAPGFGRWTAYLKELCDRLIVVDLSAHCIDACRRRFARDSHIEYHVNDGTSLEVVEDDSIDFAFSFDSLVHVEHDVISAYISQLARKLKPDGVAFLHHSNAGAHSRYYAITDRIPHGPRDIFRRGLDTLHVLDSRHLRARTVCAEVVRQCAHDADMAVLSQELVNWGTRRLIDCFSVLTRAASEDAEGAVLKNRRFMREARDIRRKGSLGLNLS
jgi:ubiquinone/menaquinone biosynthesis C-methylase UbiE